MSGALLRVLALACGAALLGAMVQAKPAKLTADQMLAFGEEAMLQGFGDQALAIADALLRRNPDDSLAYALKAQALRVLQRLPESEAAAHAAWDHAKDAPQHYQAATVLAQALSLQGHRTTAQFWLRQAVQNAPSGAAQQQALQDFAYVRSQNPLSLQIDASIRPSDNVNGGARDPLFEFMGIPFILSGDALALSGLSWGAGVQGRYTLAESDKASTTLTFAGSKQGVVLSNAAQAQAPFARNADYALGHVEVRIEHEGALQLGPVASSLTTSFTAGHSWYGGRNLSNSLSLGADLNLPVGASRGTLSASLTRQNRLDHALSSSNEAEVAGQLVQAGPMGDRWQEGVSVRRVVSDDIGIDHAEATVSLDWQARHPVAGFSLGAGLSLRGADYGLSLYSRHGRQDVRWAASLSATVDQITYLGFSPVLSLEFARNNSNIALYDTQTVGIGLSVRSRF